LKYLKERKRLSIKSKGSKIRKKNVRLKLEKNISATNLFPYSTLFFHLSGFKLYSTIFGEHVWARKFENMINELVIKAMLYNLFVSL